MIEFEEMQKFWNADKGENMYAINESALHNMVMKKKNIAGRRINNVEIMVSIINAISILILFVFMIMRPHFSHFINAGILIASTVYIQHSRRKRKKAETTFDRSILGELDHAISSATSMVRFNYMMVIGYLAPLGIAVISSLIIAEASMKKWLLVIGAFLLSFLVLRLEQSGYNVPHKNRLVSLRKKLIEE